MLQYNIGSQTDITYKQNTQIYRQTFALCRIISNLLETSFATPSADGPVAFKMSVSQQECIDISVVKILCRRIH